MKDICNNTIQGHVKAYLVGKDSKILVADIHNTILPYTASTLASLYSGRTDLVPRNIAFIGQSGTAITAGSFIKKSELRDVLECVEFSHPTSLESDGDFTNKKPNKVVFHAHTDNLEDSSTVLYVALLTGNSAESLVLSYTKLGENGVTTCSGLQLAVDWEIVFMEGVKSNDNAGNGGD